MLVLHTVLLSGLAFLKQAVGGKCYRVNMLL